MHQVYIFNGSVNVIGVDVIELKRVCSFWIKCMNKNVHTKTVDVLKEAEVPAKKANTLDIKSKV